MKKELAGEGMVIATDMSPNAPALYEADKYYTKSSKAASQTGSSRNRKHLNTCSPTRKEKQGNGGPAWCENGEEWKREL